MLNRLVMSGAIALGCAGIAFAEDAPPAPPAPEMRQRGGGMMLDRLLNEEEAAIVRAERRKIQEAVKVCREKPGEEGTAALKKQIAESNAIILPIEKKAVARMEDGPMKQMLEQRIARQEKDPEAAAEMMAQRMARPRPEGEGGFRNQERERRGFGAMPRIRLEAGDRAALEAENAKLDKAAEPARTAVAELKKQIEASFAAQLEIQKKAVEKMADGPEKSRAQAMLRTMERTGEQMRERQLRQLIGLTEPRMPGMAEDRLEGRMGREGGEGRMGREGGEGRMGRGRMER